MNKNEKWIVRIFSLLCVAYSLFIIYRQGIFISVDTAFDNNLAKDFVSHNFNLIEVFSTVTSYKTPYFRIGYISYFAIMKALFGDSWMLGVAICNSVFNGITVYIFFLLAQAMQLSRVTKFLLMILICLCIDFHIWPKYILGDSIFHVTVMSTIWLAWRTYLNGKGYFYLMLAYIFLLFCKPSSLPYVCVFAFTTIFFLARKSYLPRFIVKVNVLVLAMLPVVMIGAGAVAYYLHITGIGRQIDAVQKIVEFYAVGQVIYDRYETYLKLGNVLFNFLVLDMVRFVGFFWAYSQAFSLPHKILNVLFWTPVYILFASACFYWFRKDKLLFVNRSRSFLMFLMLTMIPVVATFHALTIVDYDWRYRYPLLLPILLVVGCGIDRLMEKKRLKA